MKFDIWTFLFQVTNFVVLLFILKRLLFKPVREILMKRRDLVRETMEKAERTRMEALELRRGLGEEMKKLGELRAEMVEKMKAEVMEERRRLLGEAEKEAAARVEKAMALLDAERTRFETGLKENAVEAVSLFSSNLLRDIADEDLHRGIWRRFLGELERVSRDISSRGLKEETVLIELSSAYPLEEKELGALKGEMEKYLSRKVRINTSIDRTLIAGLIIRARDMVYDSSLSGQVSALTTKLREAV